MKRRIRALLAQELIVAVRSKFYLFILLILAVSTAIVYLIPDEITVPSQVYIYAESGAEGQFDSGYQAAESESELRELVGAKGGNSGFLIRSTGEDIDVIYFHNGEITPRRLNRIEAQVRSVYSADAADRNESGNVTIKTLGGAVSPLKGGRKMLLILLAFEVVVIGYLFSAVVIFQEKQEGTVRAFRVTPGGAAVYLTAKTIFWTVVGIIYGALMLFAGTLLSLTVLQWLQIMSAVVLSALFYTLLGIGIAVYFTTISEWFVAGIMVLIINLLPAVALEFPSLSGGILKWIPSYPLLFWIKDVLQGGTGFSLSGAGKLGLFTVAGAVFAFLSVRWKIMKEGSK